MSVDLTDDPHLDRALASGLTALAPEVEAVDAVLEELRPRFQRARTRRRVVQASATIAGLLVVGSVAIAEAPSARRSHVTVESPVRRSETTHARKRTSTSKRPHASSTTPTTAPAPTNPPRASSPPRTNAPVVVVPTAPPAPAPTPPSMSPTTTPVVQVQRFYSTGGSIEVGLSGGRLALHDVRPAKGYRQDVIAGGPQAVEVRFTRNGREPSEIEVRIVGGRMVRVDSSARTWTWSRVNGFPAPTGGGTLADPSTWNWG